MIVPALLGAGAGVGLLLAWWAARGVRVLPRRSARTTGRGVAFAAAGLAVGAAVLAVTGWPVAAAAAAVVVTAWPVVMAADDRNGRIGHLEAIAAWIESVRDTIGAAAGLRQALLVASEQAPDAIAAELDAFRSNVRSVGLVDALEVLADDLDDPVSDLVVVALVNASRLPAGDLGPLLGRLATSIRDDVRMHRRVAVSRQRIRTSSRIVSGCMALTFVVLYAGAGDLLDPYRSVAGQIWLAFVVAVVAGGVVGLRRMGALQPPVRFARRE